MSYESCRLLSYTFECQPFVKYDLKIFSLNSVGFPFILLIVSFPGINSLISPTFRSVAFTFGVKSKKSTLRPMSSSSLSIFSSRGFVSPG